ncbi:MAG: hypothetical protein RIB30_09890 [Thalassospira sp.]|jgi:hypothetical protein|uniref:hypothetical protein n=1 Tax=Thalassospira sp. TaxID=1912094 RepID=UPI0030EB45B2|tara:strand:- start:54360 stop:54683 length:324 start_codon:yes stop_codon:yes gene_type:complete
MSLDKFKSRLFKMDGIDNNNPMFNCIVTYTSKHGTVSDNTSARMDVDTMSHGKIHLDETDKLTSDDYHLDFSEDWQTYSSTTDGLKITGKSPKMGAYTVIIVPTSAK